MRKKVSVVGSGNVGATAAHWIASKELADVVLITSWRHSPGQSARSGNKPCRSRSATHIIGTNNYGDTAGSDIVVIPQVSAQAGYEPRRPAQYQLQS